MHIARNLALRWSISKGARTSPFVVLPGMLLFVVLPGRGRPFLTKLPGPWVYITSTPVPVPVFRCHNKLLQVKWARNADWWPRVPMFSKRAGILVSKLGAETHARHGHVIAEIYVLARCSIKETYRPGSGHFATES